MSEPNYKEIALNNARVIEAFSESLEARNKELEAMKDIFVLANGLMDCMDAPKKLMEEGTIFKEDYLEVKSAYGKILIERKKDKKLEGVGDE